MFFWIGISAWLVRKTVQTWYKSSHHAEVAKQAAHAARQLHQQQAREADIPATPHRWCKLARTSQHPVLCAVCFSEVSLDAMVKVNCCEVCGVAVHKLCRHLMPSNCKPVSLRAAATPHHWMPAACVVEDEYGAAGSAADGQTSLCLYCKEPCIGMLLPVEEPIWQCSWCQEVCHVRCHHGHHRVLQPPGAKGRGARRSAGRRPRMGQHPQSCVELRLRAGAGAADAPWGGAYGSEGWLGPLETIPDSPHSAGSVSRGSTSGSGSRSSLDGEPRPAPARGWSNSSMDESLGSRHDPAEDIHGGACRDGRRGSSLDGASQDDDETVRRRPPGLRGESPRSASRPRAFHLGPQASPGRALPTDSAAHCCRLGPASRMVVPPTCVHLETAPADGGPRSTAPTGSESEASSPRASLQQAGKEAAAPAEASGTSWTARAVNAGKQAGRQARQQANELLEGLYRSGALGKNMVLSAPKAEYSIAGLSPWHRPLLVFINTKSGPQVGSGLRRWFLRVFNPLQVVELPREDPMQALRLFSDLSNLRVLVVGGDGTVGWILGCIDHVKEGGPSPIASPSPGAGSRRNCLAQWGGGGGLSGRGGLARERDLDRAAPGGNHRRLRRLRSWTVCGPRAAPWAGWGCPRRGRGREGGRGAVAAGGAAEARARPSPPFPPGAGREGRGGAAAAGGRRR